VELCQLDFVAVCSLTALQSLTMHAACRMAAGDIARLSQLVSLTSLSLPGPSLRSEGAVHALAAMLPCLPTAASGHFIYLDISGSALASEEVAARLGHALAVLQGLLHLDVSDFGAPVATANAFARGMSCLRGLQVCSPASRALP
jgi:hypothetical protein